jgi:FtsZ-interacting cell division protein ZipA
MEFLIVLAILVAVVAVVSSPLWRSRTARSQARPPVSTELAELEAARDAKYREIRDAELDHRTGKLSDADFEVIDQALRAEAIEILNALERVSGESGYHRSR